MVTPAKNITQASKITQANTLTLFSEGGGVVGEIMCSRSWMEEILHIVGGEIWFANLRNTTILESRNSFKKGSCFEWQYRNNARAAATPPLGDPPLALLHHQHHLKGEGAVE